jgi:hypothetical protein
MKELNEQALERKASPVAPEQGRAAPSASAVKRKSGQVVRRRGRLDREVLAKLGKGLKDCFADVQSQEVPERFKTLLRQF